MAGIGSAGVSEAAAAVQQVLVTRKTLAVRLQHSKESGHQTLLPPTSGSTQHTLALFLLLLLLLLLIRALHQAGVVPETQSAPQCLPDLVPFTGPPLDLVLALLWT